MSHKGAELLAESAGYHVDQALSWLNDGHSYNEPKALVHAVLAVAQELGALREEIQSLTKATYTLGGP